MFPLGRQNYPANVTGRLLEGKCKAGLDRLKYGSGKPLLFLWTTQLQRTIIKGLIRVRAIVFLRDDLPLAVNVAQRLFAVRFCRLRIQSTRASGEHKTRKGNSPLRLVR